MAGTMADVGSFNEYLKHFNLVPDMPTSEPVVRAKDIIAGAEETLRLMREKAGSKAKGVENH